MKPESLVDLTGSFAKDLHSVLAEAARRGPLATDVMTGATVVLRQGDVETLAYDQRLRGVGLVLFDMMGIASGPLREWWGKTLFTNEGDNHRRLRSLVSGAFTPQSVEALRAKAADIAAAAVTSVRHGGDLVAACSTVATQLACRLLGVPDTEAAAVAQWSDLISPIFYVATPAQIADATKAITALLSYVDDLTIQRAREPGPDLITALMASETAGERLTHDETVTMIANLLLAGHDTSGSQIPCSILVALQHRDELAGVHKDQRRLASVVAETMRVEPSIPGIPRIATAPIELHRTTIAAGSMVLLCIASACRDVSAWREPDRFDPDRFTQPDAPRLLSFGAGTHYCLGNALAKLAVEECVRSVLATDPPLCLIEDPAEIPWLHLLGRRPARLLVRTDAAA